MYGEQVLDLMPSRYDLAAMGSFLGYDQFRKRFGTELDQDGNPRISPAWQAGIQNGIQAGSIIGLWANGYISEWLGYKKTMYGALLAAVCFNFLHFFAQNIGMVVAGSVLFCLGFLTVFSRLLRSRMPRISRPQLSDPT